MKTKITVVAALACGGLIAAVSVARPSATDGSLTGNVGPGYTISLMENGAVVTHLDPGTYTITVTDQADIHDFHLQGPGVDEATDVEGTGTTTWTVTFQNGATYEYFCDAHPTRMLGRFTVGNVPVTTTTAPAPRPALRVRAAAKAAGRTVVVTATATRLAALDFGLWRGAKRVAHATARAKTKTVRLKAPAAGGYVAKVTAKAGGKQATATVRVTVK
jgi:plastocyanin